MSLMDKVKQLAGEHGDKVEGAVDKVAEIVDQKTGGKYRDKIQSGVDAAKGFLGKEEGAGSDAGPETVVPPASTSTEPPPEPPSKLQP